MCTNPRIFQSFCFSILFFFAIPSVFSKPLQNSIPRVVLAFYDSQAIEEIEFTDTHQSAEMPLNHLGLKIRYQDVHAPLPSKEKMGDVRGILIWLATDKVPRPNRLLSWLLEQTQEGRPVIVMGSHGFEESYDGEAADPKLVSKFWETLGLSKTSEWITVTYDVELQSQSNIMTGYERSFTGNLPPFPNVIVHPGKTKSYLKAMRSEQKEKLADIVTIGPNGAYVAPGYDRSVSSDERKKHWFLNPFQFFRLAFSSDSVPKPDTTTLSGRRIYYSHIDGDGWKSQTLVPKYRRDKKLSTEVILKEILLKYPNLPVTVAPVAGDIDMNWFGTKRTRRLAQEIFLLPHVEAGSHTFSHPLSWGFFNDYNPEHEDIYLNQYPTRPASHNILEELTGLTQKLVKQNVSTSDSNQAKDKKQSDITGHYETPRVYYNGPFDLDEDIIGSIAAIQELLPKGKRVEVLQWSGDALPFAKAIELTKKAGVRNLNGGPTRFDATFDSINWVFPIGRSVEGLQQIYASASNEYTYTNLWRNRHYGFEFLRETLNRTETPVRLKPINLYYHMYSGERLASLNALKKNLDYAESKQITPITLSKFAAIAEGFYTTQLEQAGERRWRIHQRGELQTIRFDQATFDAVDFSQSEGIIGQAHIHGSLYVALDPAHVNPVIALKKIRYANQEPDADRPYLIAGRWWTEKFEQMGDGFRCQVKGFGAGNMDWYIPREGRYKIRVKHADGNDTEWSVDVGEDHWLNIELTKAPIQSTTVSVAREKNAGT